MLEVELLLIPYEGTCNCGCVVIPVTTAYLEAAFHSALPEVPIHVLKGHGTFFQEKRIGFPTAATSAAKRHT